jgi:hypothetical protein
MSAASRQANNRNPSCLISWNQPESDGGRSAREGRQGSMKPEGRTRNMGSRWAAHGPSGARDTGGRSTGRGLVRRTRLPAHRPRRASDVGRGGASLRTGGGKRCLRQHGKRGEHDGHTVHFTSFPKMAAR